MSPTVNLNLTWRRFMGLRQMFSRRQSAGSDGQDDSRDDRRPTTVPPRRHQADPATGELIRYDGPAPYGFDEPLSTPPDAAPSEGGTAWDALGLPVDPDGADGLDDPAGARAAHGTSEPPQVSAPRPGPGGLVLGSAEHRAAPQLMPDVYSPAPQPFDRSVVGEAWSLVADRVDRLVRDFYAELFVALGKEAFEMFPASMTQQRDDFGRVLVQWVAADNPDVMAAHLAQLGADHRKFGVEPHHYDLVGTALINAWRRLAGNQWTVRHEDAVLAAYTRLASTMVDGASARRGEPAAWGATVIAHERVLDDFAVLRVQPDAPYLFRAGQYLTVELASRPCEWRQMSIASAPRPDNTLDLQVRSVNATGVSASLVMHTRIGDRVRLGPPRGNDLVIEPGTLSPSGLLCVCAGTGAAPVSAVVETMLTWPNCPPVNVFVGARRAADLHPADLLYRAVQDGGRGDRVHIHGVVSDDPGYTGLRGRVEDVVPPLKDWAALGVDVLVSGSNRMIAATVDNLARLGVHPARVHFDQYESEPDPDPDDIRR